jgi:hypothetical protein
MHQRCRDRAIVLYEMAVVPHQAEERVDDVHRAWWRLVQHRLNHLLVHGHGSYRNDMVEVGDLSEAKHTL